MAREVVLQVWCDPCLANDIHEPAVPQDPRIRFTLGTKEWELDTCEVHFKELLQPVVDALQEFGIKVDGKAAAPRSKDDPRTCLACGSELGNAGSFNAHVRQQHGLKIGEYRAQYEQGAAPTPSAPTEKGRVTIEDGQVKVSHDEDTTLVTCEVCGKQYGQSLGNNRPNQALGVHKATKHGIRAPRIQAAHAATG